MLIYNPFWIFTQKELDYSIINCNFAKKRKSLILNNSIWTKSTLL